MNTHHWLNQAFAVAKGYLANRILAHCLVPVSIKMMIVKVRIIVHCLVPANSDNDSKRIGAGMDILALPLAVKKVTFIVQLAMNVTMIATMVLITTIRIRAVKPVRVIVTATEIEIVVIMTMIMIVILTGLVAEIVLNLILVKRMKVVIVVLASMRE